EKVLLESIQTVVRSRNDDVGGIAEQIFGHVRFGELLNPLPFLRLQLSLEIFVRQSFVGQEATGCRVLIVDGPFSATRVPPEASREQEQDAGPEKETALPLQAGLPQQMLRSEERRVGKESRSLWRRDE